MFIYKLRKIIVDIVGTMISAFELYFLIGYLCVYLIFKDYKTNKTFKEEDKDKN